ncbi:hypothetical protein B0H16DRAFT_828100 [Mycena metata]|uniref:Uncharacterized protein n=1 Tax=Mycena metata TaxID=1033252 RepID=A0AAD7DQ77_9AGAR|nr:hypothetical protein B0H16DRAFT_828100 [Mycena metata]
MCRVRNDGRSCRGSVENHRKSFEATDAQIRPWVLSNDHQSQRRHLEYGRQEVFKPVTIDRWVVVIYEQQRRFNDGAAQDMVTGLITAAATLASSSPLPRMSAGKMVKVESLTSSGPLVRLARKR